MERYICIHGHFYQPPRENPWLEAVELQDSAFPYHDWNERITAECYAPNGASRILDGEGCIVDIPNNYARISFNFGPTLLSWLAENASEAYQTIIEADRQSRSFFSGHGSAMAQACHHLIMPLANRRDKYTQLLWGIRDFEHHFGRFPEGLWLPETAVDLETLDLMAQLGMRFTILAPHQAHRAREIGRKSWREVGGGRIDPSRAYRLKLPSGRFIALFFYDGPISQGIAFENLLDRGEDLAHRLVGAFSDQRDWPQLVHIATDGETYGHHRRHGDMALSYALRYIESQGLAKLTNYGEYLEKHPPRFEVRIFENSSWSCVHGIDRWRRDCGCNSGMHQGWRQQWRAPLRSALEWLRDQLSRPFQKQGAQLLKDPWAARDDYIRVLLDRSRDNVEEFFRRHARRDLTPMEKSTTLKLLEMQRHAMMMFTSCGWFFDELSGLETVQILGYAGRAMQLAKEISGSEVETDFLKRLAAAESNIPEHGDGRQVYEKFVRPAMVDLLQVGAHYAVSSLFEDYAPENKIYCYSIDQKDYRITEVGKAKLAIGRILVSSGITRKSADLSFGVLHFGDHNLIGGVREFLGEDAYNTMAWTVTESFAWGEFPETVRRLDQHFGASTYSLRSLFRDEQRKVLGQIMRATLADTWNAYSRIYSDQIPLMRFLADLGVPLPQAFQAAAEFVLNLDLHQTLAEDEPDLEAIRTIIQQVKFLQVPLHADDLEYALRQTMERLASRLKEQVDDLDLLVRLERTVRMARGLPFEVNLWKVQNIYYEILQTAYPTWRQQSEYGGADAVSRVQHFRALGELLSIRVN